MACKHMRWPGTDIEQTAIFSGGGSLNPYLSKELTQFCRDNGIRAIRAKDSESTICCGAVISQLSEDFFGIRLSRANYGIEVQEDTRQYIHWFISRVNAQHVRHRAN